MVSDHFIISGKKRKVKKPAILLSAVSYIIHSAYIVFTEPNLN